MPRKYEPTGIQVSETENPREYHRLYYHARLKKKPKKEEENNDASPDKTFEGRNQH